MVSPSSALEHLGQVADHLAQVERLGLHDVLAAEHEQLAGQAGGAFGGEVDRLGGIEQLGRQVGPGQQHARVALDHREHVVEIVRDAGGQLADGLHLLRLAQLGFQVQPVGDVFDVAVQRPGWRPRDETTRTGCGPPNTVCSFSTLWPVARQSRTISWMLGGRIARGWSWPTERQSLSAASLK